MSTLTTTILAAAAVFAVVVLSLVLLAAIIGFAIYAFRQSAAGSVLSWGRWRAVRAAAAKALKDKQLEEDKLAVVKAVGFDVE